MAQRVLIFSICSFFVLVRALCEYCCRNSETAVGICHELIEKRAQTMKEKVEAYVLLVEIYICMHKYQVPAALGLLHVLYVGIIKYDNNWSNSFNRR